MQLIKVSRAALKTFDLQIDSARISLIGIAVSVIALSVVSAFAVWSINSQANLTEMLYRHPFTVSTNVLEANGNLVAMHRYMKDVVIARDKPALDLAVAQVAFHEEKVLTHLEVARREFLGRQDRFERVIDAVIGWRVIRSEVINLSEERRYEVAAQITLDKGAKYVAVLNGEMNGLVRFARKEASEFLSESIDQRERNINLYLSIYIIILIIILITFIVLYKIIKKSEEKLREREIRFRSIFNNIPVSVWDEDYSLILEEFSRLRKIGVIDLEEYLKKNPEITIELANKITVRQVNPASLRIFSSKSESELISSIAKTFGEGAMDVFAASLCALWSKDSVFVSKANYIGLDGRKITGRIAIPLPANESEAKSVPVVIQDITQTEQSEQQLRLLASVFTHANEGICITSDDGSIMEVNSAFSKITGYSREDVLGRNPRILKSDRQDATFYTEMWAQLLRDGNWRGEVWNRKKDGSVYPQILTIGAVRDESGRVMNFIGLFSDISRLKSHEEELRLLAQYDALTSLPNRVLLADRLQQAMASSRRRGTTLAVAFIDLDGFKSVNDHFGHDVGDDLLVAMARRLEAEIREVDTLSRIGGDEFVAIFGDLDGDEFALSRMLERLLSAASETFDISGNKISLSASIGATFYPQEPDIDGDQLQRQADQAMYEAKLAGRNTFRFFDPKHDSAISTLYRHISDIKTAIVEERFELFYQPKLNMKTGEVVGAEALIRWNHPAKGLLAPGEFLPQIDGQPVMADLGDWVLRTAIRQLEAWTAAGFNVPVSVNIAAAHLQRTDFVGRLDEILKQSSNFQPHWLELEILETSALEDLEWATRVISKCKDLGVSFALDDFGSGYSSLVYLKRLPVDVLKIDQSFVRSMLNDPEDTTILKGVIGLAENFRLRSLAEGVETVDHAKVLLELGCIYGQGYAISRPIPALAFADWLQSWDASPDWMSDV